MTSYIIGADECGLGAWAGPLVTCATLLPVDWAGVKGLNDSKKLSRPQRLNTYARLGGIPFFLMSVSSEHIDRFGIRASVIDAHTRAILAARAQLPADADVAIVVDGDVRLPRLPQAQLVPKADGLYPAVMAASIFAKVNRDMLMLEYDAQYPVYNFAAHVGYGTKEHHQALQTHGICPLHRRSYAPIAALLQRSLL